MIRRQSQPSRGAISRRAAYSQLARLALGWLGERLTGLGRLFTPAARGVYHPQPASRIVLGVALPPDADLDAIGRRLWWRGLGIVARDGQHVAGADITAAAEQRRARQARIFVTRQLRDAGVRGAVRRWEA